LYTTPYSQHQGKGEREALYLQPFDEKKHILGFDDIRPSKPSKKRKKKPFYCNETNLEKGRRGEEKILFCSLKRGGEGNADEIERTISSKPRMGRGGRRGRGCCCSVFEAN